MLLESEHVRLPVHEEWFQQSLAETIDWCAALPLQVDFHEDPETQRRRQLGKEAGELYRQAFLSDWPDVIKKVQYSRAGRLSAQARLHEIAPLHAQLRSPLLQPESFYPGPTSEKCSDIVRSVVTRKAEQLRKEGRNRTTSICDLAGGRLLLFISAETLDDGAAQYSSNGFFDVHNSPPWDTWVAFIDGHVVSWVPPQLIELAIAGVEVNPEQCILWA